MDRLRILHYPDERLRRVADPVEEITPEVAELIQAMIRTMYQAPGVGLAATQVGVPLRLAVIDLSAGKEPDGLRVLVDPEILERRGEEEEEEGCLSVPDVSEPVRRAAWVRVAHRDGQGRPQEFEAQGLLARAVQHEVDHLDGILFIDRLSPIRRDMVKRRIKKAIREGSYAQRTGS